jgi:two-component system nitrogen regulation sensor histidine kinase NtrY
MLIDAFNKMTDDLRINQQKLKTTTDEVIRSNQELEQRRLYMETVLRNVTAGVISIDKEGNVTTINNSALRLLNIETDDVHGKNFRDILKPAYLDIAKEMLRDLVISKKGGVRKQITLPLKDGQITLLTSLSILRDDNDEFMGTVVVFDDMTQLIKAQRMAAWREVARRIAHEIKNPLTPIQLSAQRLRKRYLDRFDENESIFDECTQMIIRSVDELKTLVNEFSSFARMPASHPALNNINELISEAISLYDQAHKNISFTFAQDGSLPSFLFDRDQIKRVFINLLDNAVAAVGETGSISVDSSYNKDLNIAVCTVADNGQGILPGDRDRLFEPYFSTKKSGTGLGLAIVNTIISDHNGFIRVKDNSPKGTKFVIELPVTF